MTNTSQKGFSSVFLTMIFGTMIMLTFAFIHASTDKAVSSCCDAVFTLAGQSVLTEFDLELKEKYGLIGYSLSNEEIETRLTYYANSTFKSKRELNMIPIHLDTIEIDLKEYSMMNVDNFEKAIVDFMTLEMANKILEEKRESEPPHGGKGRILRNQSVQNSLPSRGASGQGLLSRVVTGDNIKSLEIGLKKGSIEFLINTYIFDRFSSNGSKLANQNETFFKNEVEYILYGKFSDYENKREFISDFIKLRTTANLIHIYTDSIKMKEIAALAETLTPGPAAIATQAVIAAAWSYAEARNDEQLLLSGKKVALIKKRNNWALDIASYEKTGGGVIEPLEKNGLNYQDYLKLFICLESREIKLLRIMDLIQINLAGNYDENFLISRTFTGLRYIVIVNGKRFNYEQKY